jgi:serine/threonine protein kinase
MVGAKEELCAVALLFPILAIVSLAQSHGNTTFSFLSFGNDNSNQLIYMGNASFNSSSNGYIDLTPSPNTTSGASSNQTTDQYSHMYNCIGRVLYHEPITVWPATFTTTFTMFVQIVDLPPNGLKNFNGDGLAFIIVPNDKPFLPESYGSFLGMFDSSTNGNTSNQLVIEFDTFKNEWDPNDNHVGIDINGIISNSTASLGQNGIDIKSGRPIRVQIHYDGWNKTLQISAAYADQPIRYSIILNRTIELSITVPRSAYLGFSAATSDYFEIQRIWDWNFSSHILPESSLNIPPIGGTGSEGGSTSKGLKIGLLAGSIIVGAVLLGLTAWFVARSRKRRRRAGPGPFSGSLFSGELAMMEGRSAVSSYAPHRFSYKSLSTATKNFSETELLGTGGFGSVYRGTLEGPDRATILVAVKRISAGSRQGEREFVSEIITIGRLRHRNLVQLQGWCHERDELLLVYDYMPNGSLDKVIFRHPGDQNQTHLNWARRHRILCGLASALLYLHEESEWEQRVVHRDIKPSNVMLDGEFNARLGDFGLARLIEHDETNPAVTTMLAGTPGYVAPECGYTGKVTAESDVFSFGVVLLEVASGRRVVERKPPLSEGNLVDWIWGLYGQGKIIEAADPTLAGDFEEEQMKRAVILGLACSHPDPRLRPSIRQALQVLINPSEQMMELPSSRPLAIYVVLPSNSGRNSRPASSYSNVDHLGSASTGSACGGGASITASTLHYGR